MRRSAPKPKKRVLAASQAATYQELHKQKLLERLEACKRRVQQIMKSLTVAKQRVKKAKERLTTGKTLVKKAVAFLKKSKVMYQSARKRSAQMAWKALTDARPAVRASSMMDQIYYHAGRHDDDYRWPSSPSARGVSFVPGSSEDVVIGERPTNEQFRFVAEVETAIIETERLFAVVSGAEEALQEATANAKQAKEELDQAEADVKEIESELDEAQQEMRELECLLEELNGPNEPNKPNEPEEPKSPVKKPRQKRVKSDAPRFTPAAKEAMIESMFDYFTNL